MKKNSGITIVVLLLCAALSLSGLSGCGRKTPSLSRANIMHEEEFGGVYIDITIDDFNKLGFEYGDSVDVEFSNGCKLEDIPYYNGYYTQNGEELLVAYPGYPYIKACINNGNDLWEEAGLASKDSAEVVLREKGKYKDIQSARDIHYEDDRSKFPSDEAFANFRDAAVGDIRPGVFFRSASPCDNQHKRAPYVDKLIESVKVQFILNLADTPAKIEGYINAPDFNSPYFLSLYRTGMVGTPLKELLQSGQVDPIALNMNYSSPEFRQKVANGFIAMAESEGPYLVHCTEGKDRTGFVCILLQALCGASYEEIVTDYMITYDNYYEISTTKQKDKYDVIVDSVLKPMVRVIDGGKDNPTVAELKAGAEQYLLAGGMSRDQIQKLRDRFTGAGQ